MRIKILLTISMVLCWATMDAQIRQWGVQDGLPTGEVRQIIALPNHQMLVNCEGVFCISNGAGFTVVSCDRRKAYKLEHYADSAGYGHQWQGCCGCATSTAYTFSTCAHGRSATT